MRGFLQNQDRPGARHLIGNLRGPALKVNTPGGGADEEKTILTARIDGGVFYLEQSPSTGGFTAEIVDGVFFLRQPAAGSNYTAEIRNDIFYLTEV